MFKIGSTLFWLLIFALVLLFMLIWLIWASYFGNSRIIDLTSANASDGFIQALIRKYAINKTRIHYNSQNKPIRTQKGAYRVDFSKDTDKYYNEVVKRLFIGSRFRDDFIEMVGPTIKLCELESSISKYLKIKNEQNKENFKRFNEEQEKITPEDFFSVKNNIKGDIVGVYIIHNCSKDKYYVGQAKRLYFRVNQHFTGHGNGDVYADYKYGDQFTISIVALSNSGYSDLDALERNLIKLYDAYDRGYNRTNGNK